MGRAALVVVLAAFHSPCLAATLDLRAASDALAPAPPVTLGELLIRQRKFRYWYDFGDDWWHTITIETRLPPDPALERPTYTVEQGEISRVLELASAPAYQASMVVRSRPKAVMATTMRRGGGGCAGAAGVLMPDPSKSGL